MRTKTGIVASSKMDKTIVVRVVNRHAHPKYKKMVTSARKFYAHDPDGKYKEGDSVTIYETRPMSKLKRWTVVLPAKGHTVSTQKKLLSRIVF